MLLAVTSALLLSLSFVSTAKAEPTVVATISVGSSLNGVAYDSGMGEVFVTSLVGTVSVISDVTNTVVATIPVGASGPYGVGVAYDSGMGEVLVTNFGVNTVSVISDVSNTVVATIPVGLQPLGVAYDSGMGEVLPWWYSECNLRRD